MSIKDIHQNPELDFMKSRTSKIIADEFTKLDYEVKTGMDETGVVGIIKNYKKWRWLDCDVPR